MGINQIERISGNDRYETSAEIIKKYNYFFSGPVYVESDNSFVDALPGTSLAAKNKSPIILVNRDYVPSYQSAFANYLFTVLPINLLRRIYGNPNQN
jgi:putative cell wall-binding protein